MRLWSYFPLMSPFLSLPCLDIDLPRLNINYLFICNFVKTNAELWQVNSLQGKFDACIQMLQIRNVRSGQDISLDTERQEVSFCLRDHHQGLELLQMSLYDILVQVLLDIKACLLLLYTQLLYTSQLERDPLSCVVWLDCTAFLGLV